MPKVPDLNVRQRLYLLAALKIDQRQEERHGWAFWQGDMHESQHLAFRWR